MYYASCLAGTRLDGRSLKNPGALGGPGGGGVVVTSSGAGGGSGGGGGGSGGSGQMVAGNTNSLRNATIQAMSNLLSANIDSGLMHSIGLGYHKDLQTRAAFMEVLTKILQQGTEFDTLAENVLADRFDQLVQLVTMIGDKGELPIAMALANVVTSNQVWPPAYFNR